MTELLRVEGVGQSFGGHRAVDSVSFEVEAGSVTSLIGPNGAGKTTMFNLISGLLRADSGTIRFRDRSIEALPPFAISRLGIGRTFQDPRVFAEMSVRDNVIVGARQRGEHPWWALARGGRVEREWREVRGRADEALAAVGLLERADDMARDLSFGEQRFLSIARTLVGRPALVLMDEPTVGLDRAALDKLIALMHTLVRERATTILLIEHNMEVVMSISSRIVLLVGGRVVANGTPDALKNDPNLAQAYLGRDHAAHGH